MNGHGFHDTPLVSERHPNHIIDTLKDLRVSIYKVLVDGPSRVEFVRSLKQNGIEPVIRYYAPKPHPNFVPDPAVVKSYVEAGAKWFETGNEPNLYDEWSRIPSGIDEAVELVVEQFCRHEKIVRDAGGRALFYALSPGGNYDHRQFYKRVWQYAEKSPAFREALSRSGIALHPRPHNVPPDVVLHWTPGQDYMFGPMGGVSTVSYYEYQWIARGFAKVLGKVPVLIFTEDGYSKGRWDARFPYVDDTLWAKWNAEAVRMLNPHHPRAFAPNVLGKCYWCIKTKDTLWPDDGPFFNGDWPAPEPHPKERSWGAKLREMASQINWNRTLDTSYLLLDRDTFHKNERTGKVHWIVVHSADAPATATPERTAWYFVQNTRSVSINEFVSIEADGVPLVWRYMDDTKWYAYHAGYSTLPDGVSGSKVNAVSWGIEIWQKDGEPCDPRLVEIAAKRVALACRRWGLDESRVVMHREIDPTRRRDPIGVDGDAFRELVKKYLSVQQNEELSAMATALWEEVKETVIPLNKDAAAWKAAQKYELGERLSSEGRFVYNGVTYVGQVYEKGYVLFVEGDWENPIIVPRDNENPPPWEVL